MNKRATKKDKMEYVIEMAKEKAEGMFGGKYQNSGIQWLESSFPNSGDHKMKHMENYRVFLMSHIENYYNPENPNPRYPRNNPLLCCVIADYGNDGTVKVMAMMTWDSTITFINIYKNKYKTLEMKLESEDDVYDFINVEGGRSFSEIQDKFGDGSGVIITRDEKIYFFTGLEYIINDHIDHFLESKSIILSQASFSELGYCSTNNLTDRVYTIENLPSPILNSREKMEFLRSRGYNL